VNTMIHQALELLSLAAGAGVEIEPLPSNEVLLNVDGRPLACLRLELWRPGAEAQEGESVLWVLRKASPGDLERLRNAGSSFVTLSGAVRIQAPGILIDRGDLPRVRPTGRDPYRSAFSDRASLVPRTLFAAGPGREWGLTDLAAAAGVSKSVASYAVRDLAERSVVEVRESGRKKMVRLVSRPSLVEEWSREYRWRDNRSLRVQAPVGAPERFLGRLAGFLGTRRWAATLQAGASLIVRHAPVEEVHVYLDAASPTDLAEVARQAGWNTGQDGLLHLFAPNYRTSLWHDVRKVGGIPVVSTLQLILDLWHHPVRGREQARILLEHEEGEGKHEA
jgi:hypothetical protein